MYFLQLTTLGNGLFSFNPAPPGALLSRALRERPPRRRLHKPSYGAYIGRAAPLTRDAPSDASSASIAAPCAGGAHLEKSAPGSALRFAGVSIVPGITA